MGILNVVVVKMQKKWLEAQGKEVTFVDMIKEVPSKEQLEKWMRESGLSLRQFFLIQVGKNTGL